MVTKEEFDVFKKTLDSQNFAEECNRIKEKRNLVFKIGLPIECVVFLILAVSLCIGLDSLIPLVILPVFLLTIVLTIVITFAVSLVRQGRAAKKIKTKNIEKLFDCLFASYPNREYEMNSYISSDYFKDSGFGGSYDHYHGEDLLSLNIPNQDGTPSDSNLKICDLHVTREEEETNSDGSTSTRTVTVFSGAFGYVEFPNEFTFKLGINSGTFEMKKIKLEDIEFNKMFGVRTSDQIEALRMLTPTFMQKLKSFQKTYGRVRFLIKGHYLYIALSSINMFEIDKPKKGRIDNIFDKFYEDATRILLIIEEIQSNKKFFKLMRKQ